MGEREGLEKGLLVQLVVKDIAAFAFVSSVRSSSGDHGLIEIQQQQQGR